MKRISLAFLVALMMTASTVSAQTIDDVNDLTELSEKVNAAVICEVGGSFTLTAAEGGSLPAGIERRWSWEEVKSTGATVISGVTTKTLSSADLGTLTPGYHTYRVTEKYVNTATLAEYCPSDPTEYTVFVLPSFTTASQLTSGENSLIYCETDVPAGIDGASGPIKFTANLTFPTAMNVAGKTDGGGSLVPITNPSTADFAMEYRWFKVPAGTDIATFDPENAEPGSLVATTSTNTYTVAETSTGSFNYFVVATYKIKDDCSVAKAAVTHAGNPVVVTVLPRPSKPTITIQ